MSRVDNKLNCFSSKGYTCKKAVSLKGLLEKGAKQVGKKTKKKGGGGMKWG